MTRLDRSEQCYRDAVYAIYDLAHCVAVNGLEQNALVFALQAIEDEAIREGTDGAVVVTNMLGVIMDGLKFGNWPWIKNGVNTLQVKS